MTIRAAIFDIGGVLEVNPSSGWQARWATALGLELPEMEHRLDLIWGPGSTGAATLDQITKQTAEALDLDEATLAALMNDAWTEYLGTVNEELASYFASLRPRYRTGILSNSFVGAREREQAAYSFEDMCDAVVYSHEEGYLKPDPRIYRVVCERLGVPSEDTVLLDDVQANVDGAGLSG